MFYEGAGSTARMGNTMIKIKETKSVTMMGDEQGVTLSIGDQDTFENKLAIPMRSVFQVKRGLESYIQKFYRKPKRII